MSNLTETNSSNETEREAVLEVTEETYQQQLAAGRDPESLLVPGAHRFRRARHVVKPHETVTINGKVRVTLYLDADIVESFRQRGPRYQTEINRALRQLVETESYAQNLLSDEFLERLAARLSDTLHKQAA